MAIFCLCMIFIDLDYVYLKNGWKSKSICRLCWDMTNQVNFCEVLLSSFMTCILASEKQCTLSAIGDKMQIQTDKSPAEYYYCISLSILYYYYFIIIIVIQTIYMKPDSRNSRTPDKDVFQPLKVHIHYLCLWHFVFVIFCNVCQNWKVDILGETKDITAYSTNKLWVSSIYISF